MSLPLLLGGCGEKESVTEVTAVEEKQQEVKPEEPVAETKPKTEGVTVEELEEIDEGEHTIYESIEDIWPDYIQKEDFFHNEEDEGFDYDDV